MRIILAFLFISSLLADLKGQEISLNLVKGGFSKPVDISHAGDERLFITEKDGIIKIVDLQGNILPQPFLNIDPKVNSSANERGLLGLCFHPNYKENGYFFVHYNNNSGHSTISRFKVSDNNPNIADPNSEKIILVVNQPFNNHNAGDLEFGPDGYLYIGFGDGGSGGDPGNRSQDPKLLLGKMLRIDVNTDQAYVIPSDNPYVNNTDTLPEIWATGLRNPWRFSFDRVTGDMWIADVGQNKWEEINFTPAGTSGLNYGWRCYEGLEAFNTAGCKDKSNYVEPIFVYRNRFDIGCSVTGGFVYRGKENPRWYGTYFFADFCSGKFWSIQAQENGTFITEDLETFDGQDYSSFGEDVHGEIYVVGLGSGNLYKLGDPKCDYPNSLFNITNPECIDECNGSISANLDPQFVGLLWENSFEGPSLDSLCAGQYSVTLTDDVGCIKHYSFELIDPLPTVIEISVAGSYFEAFANEPVTWQWFRDNVKIEGATNSGYDATSAGTYFVQATNENGCVVNSESFLVTKTKDIIENKLDIQIIQNPVNKLLEWKCNRDLRDDVALVNNNGQSVFSQNVLAKANEINTLNVSTFADGIYIFLVTSNNEKVSKSVVIKNH